MTGLAAAFEKFGARGKNPRRSWSARTASGKVVVMTFWKDRLDYSSMPISYSTFGTADLASWTDLPGNQERIENLKWARDHCDGLMHAVIIEAVDENARPRSIASSFAHPRLVMKLTDLNESTGEFSAINVGE